jgi:hypothetical protein
MVRNVITFTLVSSFIAALLTSSIGGTMYRMTFHDAGMSFNS